MGHVQHGLLLADLAAAVLGQFPATALGDPVDEVEHVGPTSGGELFAVFTFVQVLLVVDVLLGEYLQLALVRLLVGYLH